ncbi:MAG: M56 family metallopeptidase [Jejuia sp.]
MLSYIIQTTVFQFLFLAIYDSFLKRETFFNWNRAYLVFAPIVALIIPFIKIKLFQNVLSEEFVISLPEVFIGETEASAPITTVETTSKTMLDLVSFETILYMGMLVVALLFIYKLYGILKVIRKNPKVKHDTFILVRLLESTSAFSFFNYVFLGEGINKQDENTILQHEAIHVKHRHSLDLLCFELLKIVLWFNPLIYMFQNRLGTLHEYIADAEASKLQTKNNYYQNLLAQVFETNKLSFINSFFKQSLIKKRIIMLQKSKTKKIKLLKFAMIIPLIFGMLVYTSSNSQERIPVEKMIEKSGYNFLSDKELKAKIYQEIIKKDKSGVSESEIIRYYMSTSEKYIIPKLEYYRNQMYYKYFFMYKQNIAKEKISKGLIGTTYEEYLDYKKTEEARRDWEYRKMDEVRLVVDDLENLTVEENEMYNKRKEEYQKDDNFTSFVVTDGNDYETQAKTSKTNIYGTKYFEVSFATIDEAPTYVSCELLSNGNEKKECTSNEVAKYVIQNFNTKLATDLNLKGKQKINVIFKINKEGEITNVRARAPHPDLEKEAIRVVKSLPKFIPGKHKGQLVNVPYSLPIVFQVAD